jgi:chromosome segregation ATPase
MEKVRRHKLTHEALQSQLDQAELTVRSLQKENKRLMDDLEKEKIETFKKDIDLKEMSIRMDGFEMAQRELTEQRLEFEREKETVELEVKTMKDNLENKTEEFERKIGMGKRRIGQLEQENMTLKNQLKEIREEGARGDEELLQILKQEQNLTLGVRVNKVGYSYGEELKSVSVLNREIYELQLLLIKEQGNSETLETLTRCLKKEIEELSDRNRILKQTLENEREKLYSKSTSNPAHTDANHEPTNFDLNLEAFKDIFKSVESQKEKCELPEESLLAPLNLNNKIEFVKLLKKLSKCKNIKISILTRCKV